MPDNIRTPLIGDDGSDARLAAARAINGQSSVTGEVGCSSDGEATAAAAATALLVGGRESYEAMTDEERRRLAARLIRIESAAPTPRPGEDSLRRERRRQARRREAEGASFSQSVINVVQVFMGIGMLSMPYAMRLSGWSGLGALLAALALFNASAHLLVGGLEMLPPGVPRSYPSLGKAAFGTLGRRLVGLLALSEFGGGAIVTFAIVFHQIIIIFPEVKLSLVAPLSFAATVPLLALPSFKSLTPLSALGCFSGLAVGTAVLSCVLWDPRRVHYGGNWGEGGVGGFGSGGGGVVASVVGGALSTTASARPPPPSPPGHHAVGWGVLRAVGIFSVGVSGHSSLPALRASMAQPEQFHSVLDTAFLIMGFLYGGTAAAGYYYFGDGSEEVVTANLKKDSPFAGARSFLDVPGLTIDNAIGAFVLLNAFTTYPALIMIVQDMIWTLVSPFWGGSSRRADENDGTATTTTALVLQPLPRFLLRLAAATLTASVAVGAYAAVADCLALLGGASSMSCSLLLPAACYLKLAGGPSSPSSSSPADAPTATTRKKMTPGARRALIAMLAAGTALTLAVVAQSLGDLVRDEEKGGRGSVLAVVRAATARAT